MGHPRRLADLTAEVVACRKCPRLVAWREEVAKRPPLRYGGQEYWARPVPGFGDPDARILIVGLAPAAHGGNRTGRIFTGDRSGDWLFASLFRTGLANRPTSEQPGDGLRLRGAYIAAVNRCAPPGNRPTPAERDTCLPYLGRELELLDRVTVLVALGSYAWSGALRVLSMVGDPIPRPRPRFAHGAEVEVGRHALVGCYHPSQQNTFTGVLTEAMTDRVFIRARRLARRRSPHHSSRRP
jgi:uracil-DNA glycosylase